MKPIAKVYFYLLNTLSLLLSTGLVIPNTVYPEKIAWHTHFKAAADENSPFAALTTTIWEYRYDATIMNNKLHIDFNFLAGVDPENSWVKTNRIKNKEVNKHLLNHEQGHVYINFLQLKEGEKSLRMQNYTINNYRKLIPYYAKLLNEKYGKMHIQYDKETAHGTALDRQKKWDIYFQNELRKYPNRLVE